MKPPIAEPSADTEIVVETAHAAELLSIFMQPAGGPGRLASLAKAI